MKDQITVPTPSIVSMSKRDVFIAGFNAGYNSNDYFYGTGITPEQAWNEFLDVYFDD